VIPHTDVHGLSRLLLESIQDILVIGLVLVLFALMARTLWRIAQDITAPRLDFRFIISEVPFMLVMVELVRLMIVYLRDHHVAVDFMVELGIVSTLREVVLRGVVELEWQEIIALAVFLAALGVLLRFGDLRLRLPVPSRADHQRAIEPETTLTSRSSRHARGAA
jgi:uncharacterized membrane protein (DUF373 family)